MLSMISKMTTKVHEVMFFDMQKYVYSKSVFNTVLFKKMHEVFDFKMSKFLSKLK